MILEFAVLRTTAAPQSQLSEINMILENNFFVEFGKEYKNF